MASPISGLGDAISKVRAEAKAEFTKKKASVTKATQDFEAVFIGMMLKQMRKSMAGDNALFGNSSEAKVYQDMLDDNMAQQMSKTGTFGLAKAMVKSIERTLPPDPDAAPHLKSK